MYENATTLFLHPGMMEKALGVLRQQILPLWKEQPGLIHVALVPDRTTHRLTVVSLWASAADAVAAERNCTCFRALEGLDSCLRSRAELSGGALIPLRKFTSIIPLN